MKPLSYENYKFQIEIGEYICTALNVYGTPNQFLISKITEFLQKFEQSFRDHLIHFTGAMCVFESVHELFNSIFK
ncbi:MAG: hypothetical protein ACFFD2_07595 [Promethearchaeota archaeon]